MRSLTRSRWIPALVVAASLINGNGQAAPAGADRVPATTADVRVQAIASTRAKVIALDPKRKTSYTVRIEPAKGWVDTEISLVPGDVIALSADGSLQVSDGHTVTADGVERGWRDMLRQFPLAGGNEGALIGRIGSNEAAVPFAIGTQLSLPVRQAGNLFVRANLTDDLSATGTLKLRVSLSHPVTADVTAEKPVSAIASVLPASVVDALPRRVTDEAGTPGDAVNFALIGTQQQVEAAFARSGWVAVDADTNSAVLNGLLATLAHKPYLGVPMSKLYLFGRAQDLSFARAEAIKVATERHHLRMWKSDTDVEGRTLWIGSATYDNGLERDERNGRMTHSIDPEIDKERDFLWDSFDASGSFSSAAYVLPLNGVRVARTATGGSFRSDGRVLVMSLN